MLKLRHPIFYFRGLNTYGDDLLHLGPIKSTSMFKHISEYYDSKDICFLPVENIGWGTIEEMMEKAISQLTKMPEWQDCKKAHFLGHSTGAVLSRYLIHNAEVSQKVISHISYGAPNRGTNAANIALSLLDKPSKLKNTLKKLGWNLEEKKRIFDDLKPSSISKKNELFPNKSNIYYGSAVCSVDRSKLSLPMRGLNKLLDFSSRSISSKEPAPSEKSDGLIEAESQIWGEKIGEFNLDHLEQIGFIFRPPFSKKQQKVKIFHSLLDTFVETFARIERNVDDSPC